MVRIMSRVVGFVTVVAMLVGAAAGCVSSAQLEISGLTVTPPTVSVGESATIEAAVTNSGQAPGSYTAVLKVSERTVDTRELTLAAGEKKTVSFQYTAESPGKHRVEVNSLAGTLEVVKPAEFQVTSVEISPAEVFAGKPFTVTAEVKNTGGAEGKYTAKLTVDGAETATKDVVVAAGATVKVSFASTLAPGQRKIGVGGVTREVKALKAAELTTRSLKVTPSLVFPGQTATVEAEILNSGDIKGTFPASLTVNGVETDSKPVTLDAGAASKMSFPVVRDLPGKYDIALGKEKATLNVSEVETYKSKMFNYSFSYPKGWELDEEKPNDTWVNERRFSGYFRRCTFC